jgi:5-methylcytosine-specific restriction endonuclease McrA
VIPISRVALDDQLAARLDNRSARLRTSNADPDEARQAWKAARPERVGIHSHLSVMAPGIERCMYCGDNLGTDVDHFEPISRTPVRTFDWPNHLLACSFCNSNQKRDAYPIDAHTGEKLLIDPTSEDPNDHMLLILGTGEYRELTLRGLKTIEIFGLNRADLVRGRADAFQTRGAVLCYAQVLLSQDRTEDAKRRMKALAEEPHASVLKAMLRSLDMPGAVDVLGADVVEALEDPRIRALLQADRPGDTQQLGPSGALRVQ